MVRPDKESSYVDAAYDSADERVVDIAIVDGLYRGACAVRAVELVKPGGVVVVDNVERYLPSTSRGPESRGSTTVHPEWITFSHAVSGWRRYWTSNGVTDTCIWFRPAG